MKLKLLQNTAFTLAIVLVSSTLAQASWDGGWAPIQSTDSMLSRRSVEVETNADTTTQQPDTEGRNYAVNEPIYSNDTEIDSIIEQVLSSRREGRNLGEYDQIYADGNIDQALQQGNDMQARNLIREKLCGLGLMSCDVEEKRPFYSTIYAQGPPPPNYGGGPYGPPKPMLPPGHFSRPPPPPPPPQPNTFGPPRKVGYEGPFKPNYRPSGPDSNYNGPYLENPPPSAIGGNGGVTFSKPPPGAVIYGSKPPGPVFNGNADSRPPYAFENPGVEKLQTAGSTQSNFYSHHAASSGGTSSSTSKFVVGSLPPPVPTGDIGLQQHVHHHYHHVEGGADAVKVPSVPIPISGGQVINTDFASLAQSSTAFTPQVQGGFSQSPAFTAGFNGASQGGLLSQNYKPNGDLYKPSAGFNSLTGGVNGFQQETDASGFDTSGLGQVSGSFHSQNPDYYKKELQNGAGFGGPNGLSGGPQYNGIDTGFGSGQYQNGFETARQQIVDCQCVPFNQCPAADRIGRKEDLILPIDPRNLDKNIEALNDEAAANATLSTSSVRSEEKEASTDDDQKATEKDETESKRAKRQATAEEKQDDVNLPLDAEGFRQGFATLQAIALVQRKILPTYGVSFGLPQQGVGGYPTNPHGDFYPAPNPHFGSIGPNGLNLGLINVNPLVSVQVSKTEFGNKVVKPYVNLHVTPNANLLQTVGNFFKREEPEIVHSTHYHHHDHHSIAPPEHHHYATSVEPVHQYVPSSEHHYVPSYAPEHHYTPSIGPENHYAPSIGPTVIEMVPSKPIFEYHSTSTGPAVFTQPDYQNFQVANHHYTSSSSYSSFSESTGGQFYHDVNGAPLGELQTYPPLNGYDSNQYGNLHGYNTGSGGDYNNFYERSSNVSQPDSSPNISKYAEIPIESSRRGKKLNYQHNSELRPVPTPAPGFAEGSPYITFPKDRRRRDIIEHEESAEKKESVLSSFADAEQVTCNGQECDDTEENIGVRAYYGNRPVEKTCRVNEVCCRRPLRPPQQQQLGRCGTRNAAGITGRIKNPVYVDGDSEFGEYPWHVAILKKDPKESIYACGGTLIDAQHVITAAHCIKSQNGFDLRARLGEWDVNHDVEFFPYIERDVVSVNIHPEYYAGTLDNDLAILKLDFPVDFTKNPHISPACLPDKFSDYTGARCWTTGWGKDAFGQQGKYQNILKEVDVPILPHHQCESQLRQTRLGYNYKLNPGFVCAGGEEGKDACKGDGGGPLVCERNGVWNVVGVVSWGIGCGQANIPGVYVKVSHYLEWINQITQYYK